MTSSDDMSQETTRIRQDSKCVLKTYSNVHLKVSELKSINMYQRNNGIVNFVPSYRNISEYSYLWPFDGFPFHY